MKNYRDTLWTNEMAMHSLGQKHAKMTRRWEEAISLGLYSTEVHKIIGLHVMASISGFNGKENFQSYIFFF